jgi:hypothetical protein
MDKLLKKCVGCGVPFTSWLPSGWPPAVFFVQLSETKCVHCRRVDLGFEALIEQVSDSTWWKPWTWGKAHERTVWTREESLRIVDANKAYYMVGEK